ncbi:MAG: alanine racemase [Patescibacteria group bacterium]
MHAWLEINCNTIRGNLARVKECVGSGVDVIAVVKTEAYGHGLEEMTKLLDSEGVASFAVMTFDEARRARQHTAKPILVMGYLDTKEVTDAIEEGFVLSLYDREQFALYERFAHRMGRKLKTHLKIETGLNRLGVSPDEAKEFLTGLHHFPHLEVEALFSHLACADDPEKNQAQLRVIQDLLVDIQGKAPLLPIHFVSSYALRDFKEGYFDAVRIGLALYGIDEVIDGLEPALTCKSRVMQVKEVAEGKGISYGHYFIAKRPTTAAVVSIGYGDGLSQVFRDSMSVLINGQKFPIVGQICMNHIIADVTGSTVKRGDEVVIIGSQKGPDGSVSTITVAELAQQGRIRHHEIVTRLGRALTKLYEGNNGIRQDRQ